MIVRRLNEVSEAPVNGVEGITIRWIIDETLGGAEYGHKFGLRFFTMRPGAAYPLHKHEYVEAVFVISGRLQFTTDGQEWIELEPGDVVYTARWEEHALRNPSPTEEATFTCCVDRVPVAKRFSVRSC